MPLASPWPPIKIGGEYEPPGKGPDMDLERRVAYGLVHLQNNAQRVDAVHLTEFRMTPTNDGWLVMLKGKRKGTSLICFFHEANFDEALRQAVTSVDSGHAVWRVEEPPPWKR